MLSVHGMREHLGSLVGLSILPFGQVRCVLPPATHEDSKPAAIIRDQSEADILCRGDSRANSLLLADFAARQ